jgi:AmmeMemoRadiSam system protein A
MTDEQKKLLLELARGTVAAEVGGGPPIQADASMTGVSHGGAFVTLRRQGRLRGCMGTFKPDSDLLVTVAKAASSAATDPRFTANPLTTEELPDLRIEVSILSTPRVTEDPMSLELGHHGIIVENPKGRGCFLPQVATEFGWDARTLLERCCRDKAHLDPQAWKEESTKVLLFSAEIFAEK